MAPPDLLVLSPHLAPPPGGIQTLAMDVANALGGRRVRVVGVSESPSDDPRVRVIQASPGRVSSALATLRYAAAVIAEVRGGPAVVHAMTWRAALPAVLLRRRPPVVLFCMGGELLRSSGRVETRLRAFVLSRVDQLVAISSYTSQLVRDVARREPVLIHPPVGRTPADVARRVQVPGTPIAVLSVGRLVKNKGHDRLLRAAAEVRAGGVALTVTIAGSGPERAALEALAGELGLGDAVRLAGAVNDAELDALYRAADVFALLSVPVEGEVEGFGIVFLEANAHDLPVVAGRSGGSVDAVADGVSGLIVATHDESVDALRRLATDDALRARLGAQGRARVAEFSLAKFGEALGALYASL